MNSVNLGASKDYQRIETAIHFLRENFTAQPSLEELAAVVGISASHLQRMFSAWAGVSPKKFSQYLSVNYAKALLLEQTTLLDAAHTIGLSGTGRLHDLFVNIEGMTPGEFKNGGKQLAINYSYFDTLFGRVIAASTSKGLCYLAFIENQVGALARLKAQFPQAQYRQQFDHFQQQALAVFQLDWQQLDTVKLHLKASPFQLKVWQALLSIPAGDLRSYGGIAQHIQQPRAARAVGSAIGSNPVAFLIPCHRAICGAQNAKQP